MDYSVSLVKKEKEIKIAIKRPKCSERWGVVPATALLDRMIESAGRYKYTVDEKQTVINFFTPTGIPQLAILRATENFNVFMNMCYTYVRNKIEEEKKEGMNNV